MSEERIMDLLEVWKADLKGQNMAPRGIVSYRRALIRAVQWMDPDTAVSDLTEELITAYRDAMMAREQSPKSVGLWLTVIRSFCRWCVRTKRLASDPTAHIVWPKLPRPKPRHLTSDEWDRLHGALATPQDTTPRGLYQWQRNRRAMYLMAYAGLRIKEVADLAWPSIDLRRGMLRVEHGKGDKARDVPIHPALHAELERVLPEQRSGAVCGRRNGKHITEKSLGHVFERWLPAIGVEGISAHRLRHTAATLMRDGGADLDAISGILGHESLDTTQIYLGPNPARARGAIETIPPPPKPVLKLVKKGD